MAKKPKRRVTISTTEAMRRIRQMLPLIEKDTIKALECEAVLESGNERVGALADKAIVGALAYNVIHRSVGTDLAMHLARLFDEGARRVHKNRRDTASIPALVRLIRQRRCQKELRKAARTWLNGANADLWERDCATGISEALASYQALKGDPHGKAAIAALKSGRDNFLAHTLRGEVEFEVIYNHLFRLLSCASQFVDAAQLAVDGKSAVMDQRKTIFRDQADEFWASSLAQPAVSRQSRS